MYNEGDKENHIRYCDIVPGYGFYSIVGDGFSIVGDSISGGLYNLIERFIGLVASFRR